MSKRSIAVILESLPIASAILYYILFSLHADTGLIRVLLYITMIIAFLGFAFFFFGRKLAGEDKTVKVLGILDWAATLSIIGFYILAIISFGL